MKMFKHCLSVLILGLWLVGCSSLYERDSFNKKTPFKKLKWRGNTPIVTFIGDEDKWYEVLAVEDIPIDTVMKYNKINFSMKWRLRFYDDMGLSLAKQGQYILWNIDLKLKDLETGKILEVEKPLYEEKEVIALRNWVDSEGFYERRRKEHYDTILPQYAYLTQRMYGYPNEAQLKESEEKVKKVGEGDAFWIMFGWKQCPFEFWVSQERAYRTLDILEVDLKEKFSYLDLRGVDYEHALDAIRKGIGVGIHRTDLAAQLKKFLALFGDAHTRMSGRFIQLKNEDYIRLPFRTKNVDGKIVAVKDSRSKTNKDSFLPELYDDNFTYVESIDGFSTEYLLQKVKEWKAHASKGLEKSMAESITSYYSEIRTQEIANGTLVRRDSIQVVFSNEQGEKKEVTYPLYTKPPPKKEEKKLSKEEKRLKSITYKITDDNIGYLRIERMRKRDYVMRKLRTAMESFKDTKGIIIDVRDNGGGNRRPTLTLLPYFIKKPRVINIAAFRMDKDLDPDPKGIYKISYGIKRFLYPRDSEEWNAQERGAIDAWLANHKLHWEYDKNKFSKLHFCVISPNQEYYEKPVVILMDEGCFSATDIFLGAFKGVKNVKLVGYPSGGGSGYAKGYRFKASLLGCQASRMASFKNNGDLYEGNGVLPDVLVDLQVADLKNGVDTQYNRAVALIKNSE